MMQDSFLQQADAFFQKTTDAETELSDWDVRQELIALYDTAVSENARAEFNEFADRLLATEAPHFTAIAAWLRRWQLTNALQLGHDDALPPLAAALAERVIGDFTTVLHTIEMLAYHGKTAVLAQLLTTAWPRIQTSDSINLPRKQELASLTTDTIIFAHLQGRTAADLDALQAELAAIFDMDQTRLAQYVGVLTAQLGSRWRLDHFDFKADRQQASQHLAALLVEMVAYLHVAENAPYTKANLLRLPLLRYFTERRTGQLTPREDMAAVLRGERPFPQARPDPHPLCPDPDTLQKMLEKLLIFSNPLPYQAAVLVELIPGWLRFLVSRGLIDAAQQQRTLADLAQLDLTNPWQSDRSDAQLIANVQQALAVYQTA